MTQEHPVKIEEILAKSNTKKVGFYVSGQLSSERLSQLKQFLDKHKAHDNLFIIVDNMPAIRNHFVFFAIDLVLKNITLRLMVLSDGIVI